MSLLKNKERLLEFLLSSKGEYVSGEDIASRLNISRSAVWKQVASLRNDGYKINAVTNKGYILQEESDVISKDKIISSFQNPNSKDIFDIDVFDEIDSTNSRLKSLAPSLSSEGKVIVARKQLSGRGRLGRSFFSPKDSGIYMSIFLKPSLSAEEAHFITTSASVAVCRAIEKLFSISCKIKWVNDIYLNGKKICGILTEAGFNLETGGLDYAVLGIGINLFEQEDGFSDDIKGIAGGLFDSEKDFPKKRNQLIALILEELWLLYKAPSKMDFLEEYRSRSLLTNREITVIKGQNLASATALYIDDSCRLVVKYDDGEIEALSCGEVSLKI